MLGDIFDDMVKAVVDIEQETIAVNAELHADLETYLLENGSNQKNLWGINIFPDLDGNDFVVFDSLINISPRRNNRSRYVEDENIRNKIFEIVNKRITK